MSFNANTIAQSPYSVPGSNALAARLTLHKDDHRSEEMYYYMCFEWEQLVDLLKDPAEFFKSFLTKRGSTNPIDTLATPVTASIRPADRSLLGLPGSVIHDLDTDEKVLKASEPKSQLASLTRFFMDSLLEDNNFVDSLDRGLHEFSNPVRSLVMQEKLLDLDGGWFLAEFANRTHFMTIYYCCPKARSPRRYQRPFTEPTVCKVGSGSFGQLHFDLDLEHDEEFELNVAKYVVDMLEDQGEHASAELAKADRHFVGGLDTIFGSTQDMKPNPKNFQEMRGSLKFDTEARRFGQRASLLIEGLSTTTKGILNGFDYPTFVCSVEEVQANTPDGAVIRKNGVLKRYVAP